MSDITHVPTSGTVFAQRIGLALFKAGLSSIPLAALAWDAATASLEFVNERSSDAFIDELGERISKLEMDGRLLKQPAKVAAHETLQRLMMETREDWARDLARAVAWIEETDDEPLILMQFASVIGKITSRYAVYLSVLYRLGKEQPTDREREITKILQPYPPGVEGLEGSYDLLHNIEYILNRHYPSISVSADLSALSDMGLIHLTAVRMVVPDQEPWKKNPIKLTELGMSVLTTLRERPDEVPRTLN